jgi:hypothetical protein
MTSSERRESDHAGESVRRGHAVRGLRHVEAAVGVEQRHHQGVLELPLAEPEAPAGTANDMGRLRHVLHSTGQDDLRLPEKDAVGCLDDRFEARAAQPVHRQRRNLLRDSGLQADVAGPVDRIP